MDRINVEGALGVQRQLVGAVQDVGRGIEIELGEVAAPREVAPRVGKQVARDVEIIVQRQTAAELVGDDGAAQVDRARPHP